MGPLTGIIVAGGKGTRFGGRDKAFVEVDGEPIIARTLRVFRQLFTQTIVVTQHPDRFAHFGVDLTTDRYPGGGPLAGIHAGLRVARTPFSFVAACDMPLLDVDVIRFLIDRLPKKRDDEAPDAIVPWWEGDVEPLHALYARRCLPKIEDCLENDRRSVRDFLAQIRVDYVAEDVLADLDGAPASFTNLNTPGELERLRRLGPHRRPRALDRVRLAR